METKQQLHLAKLNANQKGSNNRNWKGGITKNLGYVFIKNLTHPNRNSEGYIREHTLIMEKNLGRFLTPEETVHHLDGNTLNNQQDNLYLFQNHSEHMKYHWFLTSIVNEVLSGEI